MKNKKKKHFTKTASLRARGQKSMRGISEITALGQHPIGGFSVTRFDYNGA